MDNNSNMLQFCRLCLVKDEVNIPIFEEQGDIRQIFLKISSCLPVKVSRDDQLPKKICDGCSYKLDMLYEFWNTSANAEKQLLTWLGEAGMTSQMADGTISAVAQQIKPADDFVKQERIDPPDIHSEDDDKDYMFQEKQEEKTKNNVDEPPPKRARRTAAVKAAIAMDQDSDDDDSGEPMTKIEDDSEDSDNDDHEPAFVDVPSTSADDQPGPSGVGKDGVEAPLTSSRKQIDNGKLLKKVTFMCRDCKVVYNTPTLLSSHLNRVIPRIIHYCTRCKRLDEHDCPEVVKKCAYCLVNLEPKSIRAHFCFHLISEEIAIVDKSNLKCKICKKEFRVDNLVQHMSRCYNLCHKATLDISVSDEERDEGNLSLCRSDSPNPRMSSNSCDKINSTESSSTNDVELIANSGDNKKIELPKMILISEAQLIENENGSSENMNIDSATDEKEKYILQFLTDTSIEERRKSYMSTQKIKCALLQGVLRKVSRKVYSCFSCGNNFKEDSVVLHLNECSFTTCRDCYKQFHNQEDLKEHLANIKYSLIDFCFTCDSTLYTTQKENHEQEHDIRSFCSMCHHVLTDSPKKHKCFHIFSNEEMLYYKSEIFQKSFYSACTYCDRDIPKQYFKIHTINKHTEAIKQFSCNYCLSSFDTPFELRKHYRTHGSFLCHICGKRVTKNISDHFQWHAGRKTHKCLSCNKSFTFRATLRQHEATHLEKGKHVCGTCNKSFKAKYNLDVHKRIHQAVKPFECLVCHKTFQTKQARDNHMKTHSAS